MATFNIRTVLNATKKKTLFTSVTLTRSVKMDGAQIVDSQKKESAPASLCPVHLIDNATVNKQGLTIRMMLSYVN